MALFPEIDNVKTKQNVNALLSGYRTLVRRASEEYVPNVTATYSFELKSITNSRPEPIEKHVIRKVQAEETLKKIATAMNKLNAYDAQLIVMKYVDKRELTNTFIYNELMLSRSAYYDQLDLALLKFAEAYDGGSLEVEEDF